MIRNVGIRIFNGYIHSSNVGMLFKNSIKSNSLKSSQISYFSTSIIHQQSLKSKSRTNLKSIEIWNQIRFQSTSKKETTEETKTNKNIPSLKIQLRKLFLKIHPDLFVEFPSQYRETNERSFQNLQSIIDLLLESKRASNSPDTMNSNSSSGGGGAGGSGGEQILDFFIRKETNETSNNSTNNSDPSEQLQQVSVKLPSRTRLLQSNNKTRKMYFEGALRELFNAVGLGEFEVRDFYGGGEEDGGYIENVLSFSQHNSEIARKQFQHYQEREKTVDFLQTCFYIKYKVRIYFELAGMSKGEELDSEKMLNYKEHLLQSLEVQMDSLSTNAKEKLKSMTLVLSDLRKQSENIMQLDSSGRVILNVSKQENNGWKRSLEHVDPVLVGELKRRNKERTDREAALSKRLGVACIYTDWDVQNTEEYSLLMSTLEKKLDNPDSSTPLRYLHQKEGGGGVDVDNNATISGASALLDLKVRFTRRSQIQNSESDWGLLQLPFDKSISTPTFVLDQISARGPLIVGQYNATKNERKQLDKLIVDTRRRLKLRLLKYEVQPHQMSVFCTNILSHEDELRQYLYGLNINVVGRKEPNQVQTDGTLNIRWNCDIV